MLLNYFLAWSIFEILKGVWMRQGFLRVRKRIKMDVICYFELKIKLNLFVSKGPSTDMQIYQGLIPRFHTSVLKALASKKPVIVWGWRKRDFLPLFFQTLTPIISRSHVVWLPEFQGSGAKRERNANTHFAIYSHQKSQTFRNRLSWRKAVRFLMPHGRRIQMIFFLLFFRFCEMLQIVPVTTWVRYNFLRP